MHYINESIDHKLELEAHNLAQIYFSILLSDLAGSDHALPPAAADVRMQTACEDSRFSLHNGFISFHSCWIMQPPKRLQETLRHLSNQVHWDSNFLRNISAGIKPTLAFLFKKVSLVTFK